MMTIKKIVNGNAIPQSPKECLSKAVALAFSKNADADFIYWAKPETVKADSINVQKTDVPGNWVAKASGVVMVGKTRKKTDKFHDAKKYTFDITYRNAIDRTGLPTITLDATKLELVQAAKAASGPLPDQE
jgi:hypothetical protein